MADNVQKTPLARQLNEFANRKVHGALAQLGQALPASVVSRAGAVVTVKFEVQSGYTLPNITVPLIGSEYIRLPIAAGCLGWVMTADAYLGGVSGLGGGTAGLTPRGNLSMLVFSPIGNKHWQASENDNATVIYGPDGVVIRDSAKTNTFTLTSTGVTMVLTAGGLVVTVPTGESVTINGNVIINPVVAARVNGNLIVDGALQLAGGIEALDGSTYGGDLKTAGGVIAGFGTGDQVGLQTHHHTQPNDSHGDTEGPTAAPTAGT